MLGLVVLGSRTWMCTIDAPALAASSADVAIWAGVTGTAGFRPGVSADPVTAPEIMTFRFMLSLPFTSAGKLLSDHDTRACLPRQRPACHLLCAALRVAPSRL